MKRRLAVLPALVGALSLLIAVSCVSPSEAPRVTLPVVLDDEGLAPVTTDLGYEVTLDEARVALRGVVFTISGELHTRSVIDTLSEALVPTAYAHPGHFQGGDVTGELPGSFVVDWASEDGRSLGDAVLFVGTYAGCNFTFDTGAAPSLDAADPLVGHTAILSGRATRGGEEVAFLFTVNAPVDRELIGAPFEDQVEENATGALRLRFAVLDALEGDTLFDGVDFLALDADDDGALDVAPDDAAVEAAYNSVRRALLTHDHYSVSHEATP